MLTGANKTLKITLENRICKKKLPLFAYFKKSKSKIQTGITPVYSYYLLFMDVYTWYYVVFGLKEPSEYDGGFYFGKVTCPPDYPAKAPNI